MGRGRKPAKRKYTKKEDKQKEIEKEQFQTKVLPIIGIILGIILMVLIYTKSGILGKSLSQLFGGLFGVMQYFIPVLIIAFSIKAITDEKRYLSYKSFQLISIILAFSTIFSLFEIKSVRFNLADDISNIVKNAFNLGIAGQGGGAIGIIIAYWLYRFLGYVASLITSFSIAFFLIVFSFGIDLTSIIRSYISSTREQAKNNCVKRPDINEQEIADTNVKMDNNQNLEEQLKMKFEEQNNKNKKAKKNYFIDQDDDMDLNKQNESKHDPNILGDIFVTKKVEKKEETQQVLNISHTQTVEDENYEYPVMNLLSYGEKVRNRATSKQLANTSTKLQKTLYSFGVSVKVEDVNVGPSITRYELRPAEGVRVSKIANLADDIALNLAAQSIRIEAPIPGKQAVGIEIPNEQREAVHLRDALESDEFQNSKSKTTVALGKGVAGNVEIADISKMPHILIAGSTGSGKSVCINTIITSIIYKAKPSEVKFIMIDPKVVELSVYNGIPHLLIPVVTDPKKAAGSLAWAVQEMENRYRLFANEGVRDIKGYNAHIEEKGTNGLLPQIVIIIDELADLMMVAKNDVEDAIVRLAQKARAAGMYLVIATQRPSVDVITGLIKANVPSRIAFAVSSQIDSRTILDSAGAEKLLGKGDMLYAPIGCSKPSRIQGAFVTDDEVEKIVSFLKNNSTAQYDENAQIEIEKLTQDPEQKKQTDDDDDDTDPLLEEAIKMVIEFQTASATFIQRKFKVGYSRAGRIIDQIEARGIISRPKRPKAREVLYTLDEYNNAISKSNTEEEINEQEEITDTQN